MRVRVEDAETAGGAEDPEARRVALATLSLHKKTHHLYLCIYI